MGGRSGTPAQGAAEHGTQPLWLGGKGQRERPQCVAGEAADLHELVGQVGGFGGAVFQDCTEQAFVLLNQEQLLSYIESARVLGKLGRGAAPVLAWLETWPEINQQLEADITQELMLLIKRMQLSPNSNAIAPLIESLLPVSKRLLTAQNVRHYLSLIGQFMDQTTGSIHGRQKTLASPALLTLLKQAAYVLKNLSLLVDLNLRAKFN